MIPLLERLAARYGAMSGGLLLWQLAPVVLVVAGVFAVETHVSDIRKRERAIAHSTLVSQVSALRARLESAVNATLYRATGLIAYVATNPDITQEEFERLAREIVRSGEHIRNLGLAPDNVLRFVYPLEGNERALGLDYRTVPEQWPSVQRVMETGKTLMTGPVNLVQGGSALVARTPIRAIQGDTDAGVSERYYWGLASIVISDESLLQESLQLPGFVGHVAVRSDNAVIYGDPALFDVAEVRMSVQLPGNEWELAAAQASGVPGTPMDLLAKEMQDARLLGYGFLALLVLITVMLAVSHRRRLRDSLQDALTGLANRRLLFARLEVLVPMHLRRGNQLYLFFVDLDRFKPVNDRFGHAAGDQLLIEIARRLRRNTRRTDTVARTGGDEFVIAMPDIEGEDAVRRLADKLERVVTEPFDYRGQQLAVGCSVGWASMPKDAEEPDDLMNIADKRMYEIKQRRKQPA